MYQNAYEEEKAYEIEKILESRARMFVGSHRSSKLEETPEYLQSYQESYPTLLSSVLNGLTLEMLQALVEVRFILVGKGRAEYLFRYGFKLEDLNGDFHLEPTKAGYIKLVEYVAIVDTY